MPNWAFLPLEVKFVYPFFEDASLSTTHPLPSRPYTCYNYKYFAAAISSRIIQIGNVTNHQKNQLQKLFAKTMEELNKNQREIALFRQLPLYTEASLVPKGLLKFKNITVAIVALPSSEVESQSHEKPEPHFGQNPSEQIFEDHPAKM